MTVWEQRSNGLQVMTTGSVSQLGTETLIFDPWWHVRHNTSNPEQVICHAGGPGHLVVTQNAGHNWEDRTAYLEQTGPPNSWGDSPPPAMNQVIVKQLHGDIHKLGRFCGIAQLATGTTTDARGWLLVTDNDWFDTTWHPLSLSVTNPLDWQLAPVIPGVTTPSGLMGSGTVKNDGNAFTINSVQQLESPFYHYLGLCVSVYTDQVESCGWSLGCYDVQAYGGTVTLASLSVSTFQEIRGMRALLANCGGIPAGGTPFGNVPATKPDAQFINWVTIPAVGPFSMTFTIDAPPLLCSGALDAVSPLALDVDNQDGKRAFVSAWQNGNLVLQNWDVTTTSPSLNNSYTIAATVTISEIEQKTTYAIPHCPAYFDVSGFGDHVFVFGHFGGEHIIKSTDGGATFGANLGDPSWSTNRVGAFFVLSETEFYAFLNVGSACQIWHTETGGASWIMRQQVPLTVEHQNVSRHPSGALLMANSVVGVPAAVFINTPPYTEQYIDHTGPSQGKRIPSVPGDGGGGNTSITWIV